MSDSGIDKTLALKTWAVVGANNNQDKFGYKIFKFMDGTGQFKIYPVNPGLSEVMGHKCYPSIADLPEKPDVVDVVVPPRVGEQVMRDCAAAGVQYVWLQPGADAPAVAKLGEELGLTVVKACVMAELRKRGVTC
jgi:predicted CoA-binding protein